MAAKKSGTTRLTYSNGATVVVSSDKAERLVAGGAFTEAKSSTTKSDSGK